MISGGEVVLKENKKLAGDRNTLTEAFENFLVISRFPVMNNTSENTIVHVLRFSVFMQA